MKKIKYILIFIVIFLQLPQNSFSNEPLSSYANSQEDNVILRIFTQTAEQTIAEIQFQIVMLYYEGKSITKNDQKATEYFTKASDLNNARAQTKLGEMYITGRYIVQNYEQFVQYKNKAIQLFTKATNQGDIDSQYNLGVYYQDQDFYYHGDGVSEDYKKSIKWYTKSANQGHKQAQWTLGIIYGFSPKYPHDYTEAAYFLSKACLKDYSNSCSLLNSLKTNTEIRLSNKKYPIYNFFLQYINLYIEHTINFLYIA